MTIQDVQRRIAKEEKALAMLDTRKGQLRERKDRVVAEGKWVDAQLTQTHNAVTAAKVRLKSAEVDMNLAVAKDLAKNFNSLTIDEFIAELKTAVQSKFPFEKQIVGLLEVYACYKGVPDSELENLLVYTDPNPPYRYRKLLPTQKARVVEVLERRCPKHPQTGRYLPPLFDLSHTLKRGDSFTRINYADGAGYLPLSWNGCLLAQAKTVAKYRRAGHRAHYGEKRTDTILTDTSFEAVCC